MKQNRKIEDILNICLERMLRGETLEQCLRDYPGQAVELEPLLRTALAAKAASTLQPSSEFKARARNEFQMALNQRNALREKPAPSFRWFWQWQPAWSVALAVVVILVLSGGGTIVAARNSMPDSPLYNVKLFSENTRLALAFSDTAKAELNARFVENRAQEIVYAAVRGDVENVRNTAKNLNTNMSNISALTNNTLEVTAARNNVSTSNDASIMYAENIAAPAAQSQENVVVEVQPMLDAAPEISIPADAAAFAGANAGTGAAATLTPAPMGAARAAPEPAAPEPAAKALVPNPSPLSGEDGTTAADNAVPEPSLLRQSYGLDNRAVVGSTLTDQEKLRSVLTENYNTLQLQLEEALKIASPDIRPLIRQAIALAQTEYQKSMSNLEMTDYINNKRE